MIKNEKGFGIIEVVLVVLVIGLLITVGWLFFDRQNNQNKEHIKTIESTSSVDNSEHSKKYLEINELGVKVPLSDSLMDLKYKQRQDDVPSVFSIYSESIADKQICEAGYQTIISLYDISRGYGTFVEEDDVDAGPGRIPSNLLKQFDGFYIQETPNISQESGESCSPGYDKLKIELKEAFKSAEII